MTPTFGRWLRQAMAERDILSFIGVYNVFSASVAANLERRHAAARPAPQGVTPEPTVLSWSR
jgi:hypothetical protein